MSKCPYCGKRQCGSSTGSTVCEPDMYGGNYSPEEIAALKREWGFSECDILCSHSEICEQLTYDDGYDTHKTPIYRDDQSPKWNVSAPKIGADGTIICADFLPNAKTINILARHREQ